MNFIVYLRKLLMDHSRDKIVTFENFSDPVLAEIIKGKFEANGIPCFLKGAINPYGLYQMDGTQLMIFERDLDRAREVREKDEG